MMKDKSILIVEDDAALRNALKMALNKLDVNIDFAEDGERGIEKIKSNLPNLVLLDIGMPKMDGVEVYKKMNKNISTKDIPVIFITNFDDTDKKKELFDAGIEDYLVKSNINISFLVNKVKNIIDL